MNVVEARVTEAYLREIPKEWSVLPQLRIYDLAGNRLLALTGYDYENFNTSLASLFTGRVRADASQPLARDLARAEGVDGKPLENLPTADLTVVEMWATWCVACHAQAYHLAKFLEGHPTLRVNLLHVDADPKKTSAAR